MAPSKQPAAGHSVYDSTLRMMMESQNAHSWELEEMKDQESLLVCFRCQRLIRATDRQNDKPARQLTLTGMFGRRKSSDQAMEEEAPPRDEEQDIIQVLVRSKCGACERVFCEGCFEECSGPCQGRYCQLCLE